MANSIINQRIQYAKEHGARISTKGQNDTVIARPLILQLDEESIQGHEDTWAWDLIQILEDMFGEENILGFSVHRDETNVHIHVLFVPCYEEKKTNGKVKCTLSQTKFFRNPKQLAGMHKHIRKELLDNGYKIEKDNKPIEQQLAGYYDKQGVWHQQGLTPDQLKAITNRHKELDEKEREIMLSKEELDILAKAMEDVQEKAQATQENLETNMKLFEHKELDEKEREIMLSKEELDILAKAMEDVQEKAQATQENLETNMKLFECQQADFENEKATLHTQMQTVLAEKEKLNKMRKETDEMLEKVYSVSDMCSKMIEEEHNLNKDFLDFLDKLGRQTNIPLRQNVEKLFKQFDRERKERLKRAYEKPTAPERPNVRKRTMDDVIAERIRQKEAEKANNEFDFF